MARSNLNRTVTKNGFAACTPGAALRHETMLAPGSLHNRIPVIARSLGLKPYLTHDMLIGFQTLPSEEGVSARLVYSLQPNISYRVQQEKYRQPFNGTTHDAAKQLIDKFENAIKSMKCHTSHNSEEFITKDHAHILPAVGGGMYESPSATITSDSYHFIGLSEREVRDIFTAAVDKIPNVILQEPPAIDSPLSHIGR